MEKDTESEGRSHKNFWRGKSNRWLWVILIIIVGIAIVVAVVRYNMSVATQLQQTEQENSQLQTSQNQLQQQNNQLQANQNQLHLNQLQQQCEASCVSHSSLFSTTTWEYCSNTLGCRTFPAQQTCINSCMTNP